MKRILACLVLFAVASISTGLPYQSTEALGRSDALKFRVDARAAIRITPPVVTPPAPTPDPTPPEPIPEPDPTPPKETPEPLPASGGMVSFNLDDGWDSGYEKGLPIFDAAGIKTTYYISTTFLQYPGFVTPEQLQDIKSRGHEIGSHARNHDDLSTLSEAQMKDEINGGKQDLINLGFDVPTFAYPYGGANDAVVQTVKDAGFTSGFGASGGFNDKNTDKYMLYRWNLNSGMTFEIAKGIIDRAAAEKKWVIFVMHKVDETGTNDTNVRSEVLQQIVDYVKEKNIEVVTNSEGLARAGNLE